MSHSTTTVRAVYFRCNLPKALADALNAESGRIYTSVLVEQYRIYRKKGIWLSPNAQERYNDYLNRQTPKLLHAHSIDAAQQGFHEACKTTRAARKAGMKDACYPHKRKRYRTTVWKNTAIHKKGNTLLLSLARGQQPIRVPLPEHLRNLPVDAFTEMRLVYNRASRHYEWHLVADDGVEVEPSEAQGVAAIDLGEVHPATLTDGEEACLVMSRQLRSQKQHTAKNLASLQHNQRMSQWTHGKLRRYIGYKAAAAGIEVEDKVPEHYTSQTCPHCGNRYKPSGRTYKCPACGFCTHRDVVGASNILSRAVYGELGKVRPPETVKYRQPCLRVRPGRSSPGHGASSSEAAR